MTFKLDTAGLVAELREEAARLSGQSLDRGQADAGIAANLADRAANLIEALTQAAAPEVHSRPDENGFVIGHPVEKFTGEARWEGTLVASYLTTKGKRRYVVEVHPQGFQMIAMPAQLRMIAALTDDEDGAALAHKGEGQ